MLFSDIATYLGKVFNMSATMARQLGWVQQEQSDICVGLNMAQMATYRCWYAGILETQYRIKNPRANIREAVKPGVEFSGHSSVMSAIEQHHAIVCQNQMDSWLPCQIGTAQNLQTCGRHKCNCAPQSNLAAPVPRTTSVPPSHNEGLYSS